jgi:hypothetical protein
MGIITRFTGGQGAVKSAMLSKGGLFEAVAIGETFEIQNIFSECQKALPAFADLDDDSDYKNDYLGIFLDFKFLFQSYKFELLDEECNFVADLVGDTYGIEYLSGDFQNSTRYRGYKLEWRKVLALHGPGVYKIRVTTVSNIPFIGTKDKCSCNFELMPFTDEDADNTVKVEFVQDSIYLNNQNDFRGDNWKSMFRVFGYFGNPKPQFERSSYLNTNRQITDIQDKAFNEYTLETEHVPHCISELLIPTQENKSLASISDEVFITDYNLTNHFSYKKLPVYMTKIKVNDNSSSKKVNYEITCEDRNRKNVKRKVR